MYNYINPKNPSFNRVVVSTSIFICNLLTKDYNYDYKFVLLVPGSTPIGLVATGLTKGQIFLGDVSSQYKSGRTVVDVKVDTYSNVRT
uniref:Uncharacterized protein n=1 Tax=Helianthus annuus TaxID=4232 RepID=A0A251UMZ4_HELAN